MFAKQKLFMNSEIIKQLIRSTTYSATHGLMLHLAAAFLLEQLVFTGWLILAKVWFKPYRKEKY